MVVRAHIHESRAPIVSGQFKDSAKSGQELFSYRIAVAPFFLSFSSTLSNYYCFSFNALTFSRIWDLAHRA